MTSTPAAAAETAPVFVYGALRSGTTLFRLMLNSHPQVQNPGEVDFLFDYLVRDAGHATGWRYDRAGLTGDRIFKDKALDLPTDIDGLDLLAEMLRQFAVREPEKVLTLNVHRHISRLAEVLPHARIIHLLRDPRDVARSAVGMGWNGISYFGINSWLKTEKDWEAAAPALPQDQVLDVHFETLMEDIDGELRRVSAFLEVPFQTEMLSYHENTTYGPPDPRLANQWKRKASPAEIALMEGKCADLLEARGYTLSGGPIDRPGPLRHRLLFLQNRLLRWRHNVRRFGLTLFLSTHAARALGLRRIHGKLARQMEQKIVENLK